MANQQLAGYNTAGVVNDLPVALEEWEVMPEVEDIGSPNTESGGFHIATAGPQKCEVTIKGFYDGANNPYALGGGVGALAGLMAGNFVTLVISINDNPDVGSTSPGWVFDYDAAGAGGPAGAMVKSSQVTGKVKERVMFTAHLVGSGEFLYPAGDVS